MDPFHAPLIPREAATRMGAAAIGFAATGILPRVEHPAGAPVTPTDYGEGRRSYVADADLTSELFPEMDRLAVTVHKALVLHGIPHDAGPWHRSRFTLKVYGPGDHQGLHRDTNTLTALLLLWGSASPDMEPDDDEPFALMADPGDLIVFNGDRLPHRVRPHDTLWRVTVPFNLYRVGEVDRPDFTDRLVYGDT